MATQGRAWGLRVRPGPKGRGDPPAFPYPVWLQCPNPSPEIREENIKIKEEELKNKEIEAQKKRDEKEKVRLIKKAIIIKNFFIFL